MEENKNICRCCGSYNVIVSDMGIYEPFFCYKVPAVTKDENYCRFKSFHDEESLKIFQDTTSINICSDCDFISPKKTFSKQELDGLYLGYRNEKYNFERNCFEPGYFNTAVVLNSDVFIKNRIDNCWNFLQKNLQGKKFNLTCDFGGADGKLIPNEIVKMSNQIIINDVSAAQPINDKFIKQQEIEINSLDFALCMHVLEHLGDPTEYFKFILSKTKLGGYLYIELPLEIDENFLYSVRTKKTFVRMHEHINKFSEKSLQQIAIKNFTSIIDCGKFNGNIAILVQKKEKI